MTIPSDLYKLPTLWAALRSRKEKPLPAYSCPVCRRQVPAKGLVATADLPGSLPAWVCHTCASGPHREALAVQEAEAAAAGPADWSTIRADRGILLARCDWTQVADADLTDEDRASWTAYRQQLRNVTDDFPDPASVIWPDPPA